MSWAGCRGVPNNLCCTLKLSLFWNQDCGSSRLSWLLATLNQRNNSRQVKLKALEDEVECMRAFLSCVPAEAEVRELQETALERARQVREQMLKGSIGTVETGHGRLVGVSAERLLYLEALDMVGYSHWLPCTMCNLSLFLSCSSVSLLCWKRGQAKPKR